MADANRTRSFPSAHSGVYRSEESTGAWNVEFKRSRWWELEPDVGRVAHGIPHRVDRLRGLGNAIVPQIAEMIGAWILLREEVSV